MKKIEERNIRKLTKTGRSSLSVTVPIEYVRSLGWREKQKVVLKRVKGGILIKDWRSR